MKGSIAAACRLFIIYGIPFLIIGLADKLAAMQGYSSPIIFGCIAWMFAFHFLLNGGARRDGEN